MSVFTRFAIVFGTMASVASAQTPCRAGVRELSSPTARAELTQLAARAPTSGDLVADAAHCSADSLTEPELRRPLRLLLPMLRVDYVGGVPDPRNDDGAWTGVGMNVSARVGFGFDRGRVHGTLAPELWYAQNRAFNFFADTSANRSPFSSNWYLPPYSADLPTRFGSAAILGASFGQSELWVNLSGADVGVSSSSQAWGPGIGNHLLLGAGAPGIPRLFVRTSHPLATAIGVWSATGFVGTLTESPFFDRNAANDLRTLTAWNVAWSPSTSSGTAIGVEHMSLRTGSPFGGSAHKLTGPSDQMNGVYARAQAPDDELRAWVELARSGALPSLRQFMTVPYQGLAYTVGIEKAMTVGNGKLLLTGEATDLEQPTDIHGQATQDFYTSKDIPQGWTQRGQILGAGIGPGANSQRAAMDWVTPKRSVGLFVERVRWNEDAFLRQYLPYLNRHDVTIRAGVRGAAVYRGEEIGVELSGGKRLDYLFQNGAYIPGFGTVDVTVTELKFSITPLAAGGR